MSKPNKSITDFFHRTPNQSLNNRPAASRAAPEPAQSTSSETTFSQPSPPLREHKQLSLAPSSLSDKAQTVINTSPAQSFSASQRSTGSRVIASSDGEETDDDSDDDGIHAIFGVKKDPVPKPPQQVLSARKTGSNSGSGALHSLPKPRRKAAASLSKPVRFSMDVLLEEARVSNAIAENRRKTYEAEQAILMRETAKTNIEDTNISDKLIDEAMGGGGAVLRRALSKNEDFGFEECYEFFGVESLPAYSTFRFPTSSITNDSDIFYGTDEYMRDEMFLSGFVQDVASMAQSRISDEVVLWMLDGVCAEPRNDLVYAYMRILEALPSERLHPQLSSTTVAHMFSKLGAKNEGLNLESQIKHRTMVRAAQPEGDFWRTKQVVNFLANTINLADDDVVSVTCGLLIRSILDIRISRHSDVLVCIEDALAIIMSSIPEDDWEHKSSLISKTIISTIIRPQDRRFLLEKLPIHTAKLHVFRRRLALSFLFEDGSYMCKPYFDLVDLRKFSVLLHQRPFRIHGTRGNDLGTDYSKLESLLSIMDIALDKGDTSNSSVKEKDQDADHLHETIRTIETAINDSMGEDIMKTRTKELFDRLKFRVAFTVRSKYRTGMDSVQQRTLEMSGFGWRK